MNPRLSNFIKTGELPPSSKERNLLLDLARCELQSSPNNTHKIMQHFHKGKPVTAEEHAAAMAERKAEKLISIGELENKIDGAMAYKQKQDEAAAKLASNIKRRAAAEPAASASYLRNPAKALAAPSSLSGHAKVAAFFKSKEAAPVAGSSVKPSATLSGHALVAAYFARQSDPTAPAAQADRTPPELTGLARTSAAFAKLEK